MKVVILAGGVGSRLSEETDVRPKPMVEIGHRPILWHIMKHYSSYGFNDFVICLGYKGEYIKRYFSDSLALASDMTIDFGEGTVEAHETVRDDWRVTLVDTGQHTETAGRISQIKKYVDDGPFLMTYGDGVSDVDLEALVKFHEAHGNLATVTAVHPTARFGALAIEGDQVVRFDEKPQTEEGWINGGFFVLEPEIFDYIPGDVDWAREPMERLAAAGELNAYRHDGFWQCMDTLRDKIYLQGLWDKGGAPWKIWS
ncbi:MAG: glucose-1-phosphate cytidylyltransferase [Microthrixaceae bacterium]|nr:glucose-1-phosphate cytidylyltransferase [Microthrixaceae bacterium]HPB46033.1 glucose-1-phosphate cytidylyltransferase [Microthrixaceae bacterium]